MVVRGWARRAVVDWNGIVAPHAVRAPIRNLRELLRDESIADGNTEERFGVWARGDRRDVRFEADTRIAAEMRGGFVPDYNSLDLHVIQKEAEAEERSHPGRAEAIYMGLTESLGVHYNMMDDSGGHLWPLFEECVEATVRCIRRQGLTAEDRRGRIEYLASWSLVAFSDFMECYERELGVLCTGVDDLSVWARVLEEDGGEDRGCYWAANMREIQEVRARVLESMGKTGGTTTT